MNNYNQMFVATGASKPITEFEGASDSPSLIPKGMEVPTIMAKMAKLKRKEGEQQEDLETAEQARRFDSADSEHQPKAEEEDDDEVELAEEAFEDLGKEMEAEAEAKAEQALLKYTDDARELKYVDFVKRENPELYPTMRFDVSTQ